MHAGIFYGKQMNMDKAEKFFNMSWELSKKFYQNHPLRSEKRVISERKDFEAEFCHDKGAVLADADQCKKAEGLLLQSLEKKLELLGKDSAHPDIRYHALGNVYLGLMQPQKAIEYQEKAIEHFKSSPHNNLEPTYQSMAICFEKQGNYKDCLKYYKMAMETANKAYPSCHPRLADYKRRIACAYLYLRNLEEAEKYLNEA